MKLKFSFKHLIIFCYVFVKTTGQNITLDGEEMYIPFDSEYFTFNESEWSLQKLPGEQHEIIVSKTNETTINKKIILTLDLPISGKDLNMNFSYFLGSQNSEDANDVKLQIYAVVDSGTLISLKEETSIGSWKKDSILLEKKLDIIKIKFLGQLNDETNEIKLREVIINDVTNVSMAENNTQVIEELNTSSINSSENDPTTQVIVEETTESSNTSPSMISSNDTFKNGTNSLEDDLVTTSDVEATSPDSNISDLLTTSEVDPVSPNSNITISSSNLEGDSENQDGNNKPRESKSNALLGMILFFIACFFFGLCAYCFKRRCKRYKQIEDRIPVFKANASDRKAKVSILNSASSDRSQPIRQRYDVEDNNYESFR